MNRELIRKKLKELIDLMNKDKEPQKENEIRYYMSLFSNTENGLVLNYTFIISDVLITMPGGCYGKRSGI